MEYPDYKSHNVIMPAANPAPVVMPTSGFGGNSSENLMLGLLFGTLYNRGIMDRNTGAIDGVALNTQLSSIAQSLGMSNDAVLAAVNANSMQVCAATSSVKDSVQNLSMAEMAAIGNVKDSVQNTGAFTTQAISNLGNQATRDTYAVLDGINSNQNNNQSNFATTNSNVNTGVAGIQNSLCSGFAGINAGLCETNGVVRDRAYATDTNVNGLFATQNMGLLSQFNNLALMGTQNYNMLYNQGVVNQNATMMKLCEISSDQKAGFVAVEAKIDKSNDDQTIRAQAAYIQQLQNECNRSNAHNELNINSKNVASEVGNVVATAIVNGIAPLRNELFELNSKMIAIGNNVNLGLGNRIKD